MDKKEIIYKEISGEYEIPKSIEERNLQTRTKVERIFEDLPSFEGIKKYCGKYKSDFPIRSGGKDKLKKMRLRKFKKA